MKHYSKHQLSLLNLGYLLFKIKRKDILKAAIAKSHFARRSTVNAINQVLIVLIFVNAKNAKMLKAKNPVPTNVCLRLKRRIENKNCAL